MFACMNAIMFAYAHKSACTYMRACIIMDDFMSCIHVYTYVCLCIFMFTFKTAHVCLYGIIKTCIVVVVSIILFVDYHCAMRDQTVTRS